MRAGRASFTCFASCYLRTSQSDLLQGTLGADFTRHGRRLASYLKEDPHALAHLRIRSNHLQQKARGGMAPEEAVQSARRDLGGMEQVKENVRDIRSGAFLDTLAQDLNTRYAL